MPWCQGRLDEVKQVYEALLATAEVDPTLVYVQYMKVRSLTLSSKAAWGYVCLSWGVGVGLNVLVAVLHDCLSAQPPHIVACMLAQMARRTNGIEAVRDVFKRARKNDKCKYQVYVASAMLELSRQDMMLK